MSEHRGLDDAIAASVGSEIVTRYVVVAECIDVSGETIVATLMSPGLPLWAAYGLLRWEADGMGAQPRWSYGLLDDKE